MTGDIDIIRNAWVNLNDLTASMACGCSIEEDPPYTLDFVARQCRRFLEELDEYQQPRKEVREDDT